MELVVVVGVDEVRGRTERLVRCQMPGLGLGSGSVTALFGKSAEIVLAVLRWG